MPNFATAYKGLIIPDIRGKDWITGGSRGIEASYIAILMVLIEGAYYKNKKCQSGSTTCLEANKTFIILQDGLSSEG
jgi:hypothetical protein